MRRESAQPGLFIDRGANPSHATGSVTLRIKPRRGGELADVIVGREKFGPLSPADLAELAIADGGPWSDATRAALVRVAQRRSCVRKAVSLLAARPRSERELLDRLASAGFEPEARADALAILRAQGLVSDARITESIIEKAAQRGDARPRVERELERRGVETIEISAGPSTPPEPTDQDAALRVARSLLAKKTQPDATTSNRRDRAQKDRRRIYAALLRKGFDEETADRAAARVVGALASEESDDPGPNDPDT